MKKVEKPHIVLIGGGTGSFTLLQDLKYFTPNISALVNMCDNGGSSGRLRDELGVLPPGDVRQCLVALSNSPELREVFNYRFGKGSDKGLKGHSLGNVILSGLELQQGDFASAVKIASEILDVTGEVIPISTENFTLVMRDGKKVIRGEYEIAHRVITNRSAMLSLEPVAKISPGATKAIREADMVVIAPGNLYGSIIPTLLVSGVTEVLRSATAAKVMVSNLVTKPGQTDGWHVADYVQEVEKYIGDGVIDQVLYNTTLPAPELLDKYAADREFPVDIDKKRFDELKAETIGTNLLSDLVYTQDKNDEAIRRTLIRHDGKLVGQALVQIYHALQTRKTTTKQTRKQQEFARP